MNFPRFPLSFMLPSFLTNFSLFIIKEIEFYINKYSTELVSFNIKIITLISIAANSNFLDLLIAIILIISFKACFIQ